MQNKSINTFLLFAAFIAFCLPPLFYNISSLSLRMWDESRNAVNAFEMAQHGNYLIRYFNGSPDLWETKPPLLVWIQVISAKLFGFNELSIRLPSAIAGFLTVLLIIRFFRKHFKNIYAGIFSGIVLISSRGFVGHHVTRTGDNDAMLVLFLTIAFLYFYLFLLSSKNPSRNLLIVSIALLLAVFTKSIAGLLFLPGFLLFTIIQKKTKLVFGSSQVYFIMVLFLIITGGYYFIRENLASGYLKSVWENELFPRYFNTASTYGYNRESIWFYFENFITDKRFKPWIFLIPLSCLVLMFEKNQDLKRFGWYSILNGMIFLVIISPGTSNIWYDAPVYPVLSCFIGISLNGILSKILMFNVSRLKKSSLIFIFVTGLLSLAYGPYRKIMKRNSETGNDFADVKYGYLIKKLQAKHPEIKSITAVHVRYNAHLIYYKSVFNEINNYNIRIVNSVDSLLPGQFAMTSEKNIYEMMNEKFTAVIIETYDECKLVKLSTLNPDP